MRLREPLLPRSVVRFGIAFGILLALIAGVVLVTNYALTVVRQRQSDLAAAAQERAAARQARWLSETVIVTVTNKSSSTVSLWTETPTGTHPDGSPIWSFNAACIAYSGQTCISPVYSHRGIMVAAHSGPWSSDPTWHWHPVTDAGLSLTVHNLR